jgi:hypothetical protein
MTYPLHLNMMIRQTVSHDLVYPQRVSRLTYTAPEILTVAVVAAKFFQNHHERALCVLGASGYLSGAVIALFPFRDRLRPQLIELTIFALTLLGVIWRSCHQFELGKCNPSSS